MTTPTDIIRMTFGPYTVFGKRYHSRLPKELEPWYAYMSDGGHSIVCLIEGRFELDNGPLCQYVCPVPVKTVLREGWSTQAGEDDLTYIVTKARYDDNLGLVTDANDEEF